MAKIMSALSKLFSPARGQVDSTPTGRVVPPNTPFIVLGVLSTPDDVFAGGMTRCACLFVGGEFAINRLPTEMINDIHNIIDTHQPFPGEQIVGVPCCFVTADGKTAGKAMEVTAYQKMSLDRLYSEFQEAYTSYVSTLLTRIRSNGVIVGFCIPDTSPICHFPLLDANVKEVLAHTYLEFLTESSYRPQGTDYRSTLRRVLEETHTPVGCLRKVL